MPKIERRRRMRRPATLLAIAASCAPVICWADCPTPQGPNAWNNGVQAGYSFNKGVGGPPPNQFAPIDWSQLASTIQDIGQAMNLWINANQAGNSSSVGFYYSGVYQNNWSGGPYYIHAWTVNYPGAYGLDPGVAAQTAAAVVSGTNIVVQAQTRFYYGSISPVTGTVPLDSSAPDYDLAVMKIMLHEVGHTMGLSDQPDHGGACLGQVAGESVMNANCGTNDSAHNMATDVTSCDNQSVW